MSQKWSTKAHDLKTARAIMEEYASERDSTSLGLFEVVVDPNEKRMNFRLSGWILLLAEHFSTLYGATKGVMITRHIVSHCITQDQTVH